MDAGLDRDSATDYRQHGRCKRRSELKRRNRDKTTIVPLQEIITKVKTEITALMKISP